MDCSTPTWLYRVLFATPAAFLTLRFRQSHLSHLDQKLPVQLHSVLDQGLDGDDAAFVLGRLYEHLSSLLVAALAGSLGLAEVTMRSLNERMRPAMRMGDVLPVDAEM